jgi:hypothetical protein
MTRIITYSLRLAERNSDDYYRAIAAFADGWLAEVLSDAATLRLIEGFRSFRRERGQVDRSDAEYAFELLALGVLLREHGREAGRLPNWTAHALNLLVNAQERWPKLENVIKAWRGWAGWIARHLGPGRESCEDVERLIAWLKANDDTAHARRLAQWQEYFADLGPRPARQAIAHCLALADSFAEASLGALGKYTAGVERFLTESAPHYRRRYDAELVSRSRLEYHLGMLGTEILSRAYRQRFLAAKRKIVIVPPCMRAQPEEKCKAIQSPFGAKCQACTPSCRVHQITKLGEKRGFEVYMIPDELRVFGSGAGDGSLGVVGVACALTNWGGGWDADSMGVPAQGLLLDHVGCKYHWDRKGILTDINLPQLAKILGIK